MVYPMVLIVLMIFLIFVSAYSIAESANPDISEVDSTSEILVSEKKDSTFSWYEETAIFICLLH